MRILKFGGSSVGSLDAILKVISIIKHESKESSLAVVVSAFKGVTDSLLQCADLAASGDQSYTQHLNELENRHIKVIQDGISVYHQSEVIAHFKMTFNELEDVLNGVYLVREITHKTRDFIVSFGERFSAFIISKLLSDRDIPADFADARQFMLTDANFGSANVNYIETYKNIREYFEGKGPIQIVTGFIASTEKGETTTLGRGGSDFTASILGVALKSEVIELWSDVNGLMTANPQKVPNAFTIPSCSYEEAMELSHFGAKVIFPPTIQPAMKAGIPVHLLNTFNPDHTGTWITQKVQHENGFIKGISSVDDIALLTLRGSGMIGVNGIAARIFKAMADEGINIIMITQASSEYTVCFAILSSLADRARSSLEHEFKLEITQERIDPVILESPMSIVAVVGDNMRRTPGLAGKVFQSLGNYKINIAAIAQGSSERNISLVVSKKDEPEALKSLHEAFFSDHPF
ncbi:MAG TPA: aspartate kinase [Balneolales bacterium]|nr:aspartate kinase [Balneolales bacterium]